MSRQKGGGPRTNNIDNKIKNTYEMYVCLFVCVRACASVGVFACVHVHVCVYVFGSGQKWLKEHAELPLVSYQQGAHMQLHCC